MINFQIELGIKLVLPSQPNTDRNIDAPTIGKALLKSRNLFDGDGWYWISVGALIGFSLVFNICFVVALTYLNRKALKTLFLMESERAPLCVLNVLQSPLICSFEKFHSYNYE